MSTSPYVVRQGDYLLKLATRFGFDAKSVWELPENDALRAQRPDPNILCPGDVLYITDQMPASRSLSVGQTNGFQANPGFATINLCFTAGGQARAGHAYEIEGADINPGALDGSGKFTAQIPTDVDEFTIKFSDRNDSYLIKVGHLDPPNTESGARQRLTLLGLYVALPPLDDNGPPRYRVDEEGNDPNQYSDGDADDDEATMLLQIAVRYFQNVNGLTETGMIDADTVDALVQLVGR